jgi:hypothetical protein
MDSNQTTPSSSSSPATPPTQPSLPKRKVAWLIGGGIVTLTLLGSAIYSPFLRTQVVQPSPSPSSIVVGGRLDTSKFSPGQHTLTFEGVTPDGKKVEISRTFNIRGTSISASIRQLGDLTRIIYSNSGNSYDKVDDCFEAATPSETLCTTYYTATLVSQFKYLIATLNSAHDFQSNSNATAFCVSARQTNGNYACIDATGVLKDSATASCGVANVVCP